MRIITRGESVWLPLLSAYVTSREVYSVYLGVITHLKKGGGQTSTNTIQSAEPPAFQLPFLKRVLSEAETQFDGPGPQPFAGSLVAGQSADTVAGQDALRNAANTDLVQANQQGQEALQFGLSDVLDPNTNANLQESIRLGQQPTIDNFNRQVLPQIRSGAGDAGQFGGSRQGIAEGVAAGDLANVLQSDASRRASDAFDSGLETFNKTLAVLPQTTQLALGQGTALDAIGQQNQTQEQNLINADVFQSNQLENLDANRLAAFQQLVQGEFGGVSNSTSTGPTAAGLSPLAGAFGGAAAGAGLASALSTATTAINPILGAGIGAVLSFL